MSLFDIDTFDMKHLAAEVSVLVNLPQQPITYRTYNDDLHILNLRELMKVKKKPDELPTRYIKGYREYFIPAIQEWCISMTSLLKLGADPEKQGVLDGWSDKVGSRAPEIAQESARIGELVHYQVIDYMIKNFPHVLKDIVIWQDPPEFLQNQQLMVQERIDEYEFYLYHAAKLFNEFLLIYNDKIRLVTVETVVYNPKLKYAGRLDIQCQIYDPIEDRWINTIIDIKTSKQIYETVKTQITGYNICVPLNGWAERFYELRIHPYPDTQDYGWEFAQLPSDVAGLQSTVMRFEELQQKENIDTLLKELPPNYFDDDYEE